MFPELAGICSISSQGVSAKTNKSDWNLGEGMGGGKQGGFAGGGEEIDVCTGYACCPICADRGIGHQWRVVDVEGIMIP